MSVCAVVLTFNRKDLLVECLEALLAQTQPLEKVFVVDNASTDGTPELLRERGLLERPPLEYVRMERNLGGAGGFSRGIELARDAGMDWVWTMDDDAEPPPDSLATLLASPAAADPGTVGLCGAVVHPDGTIEAKSQRGYFRKRIKPLPREAYVDGATPEIDYASFVGLLVRTAAIRQAGLPRADFFIWGDDVEWCLRLRRLGAIRVVPESRIVHKEFGRVHTNRRSAFWNRVLGWEIVPATLEGFWRNLYGMRNYIWIKKTYEDQGPVSAAGTIAQFLVRTFMYDDHPFRRVPWILRYGVDGRRGRFVNLAPSDWVAKVRRA